MGIGERRTPQRKAYDRRLKKALGQLRASKEERYRAMSLFSAMTRTEPPMSLQHALRHALDQLKEDRRNRERLQLRVHHQDPADSPPEQQ